MKQCVVYGLLTFVLFVSSPAAALDLDGSSACNVIGGQWTPVNTPPHIGRCELKRNHTVAAGTDLNMVAGVILDVSNRATLRIDGTLRLSNTALLEFRHADLDNYGDVDVANGAKVKLWAGAIYNRRNYFNDGLLGNGWQAGLAETGVQNRGHFENRRHGVIDNNHIFVNESENSRLIGYAGSRINNYAGAVYRANQDRHEGVIENDKGAVVYVVSELTLESGGQFNNRGNINLYYGSMTIQGAAEFRNEPGSSLFIGAHRYLNIAGELSSENARIDNHGNIVLSGAAALLRTEGGSLYNAVMARIDANTGKFTLSCTRFVNKGTVFGIYYDNCSGPVVKPK